MARYKYRIVDGVVYDMQFVSDDYVLRNGEVEGFGSRLPSLEDMGAKMLPTFVEKPTLDDVIAALSPSAQQQIAQAVSDRSGVVARQ